MKRRPRAWPKEIVEVHSTRSDPRADPQATQKISRDVLEDALRRTKSGTQRIQREERAHEGAEPKPARQPLPSLMGPRDSYSDAPIVTITGIENMELPPYHPEVVAARQAMASHVTERKRSFAITPRTLIVALCALLAFVASAGVVGYLAGRHH